MVPINAALAEERIDAAPEEIRALFHEYEWSLVVQILSMVGINDDPSLFDPDDLKARASDARTMLKAEMRLRTRKMLEASAEEK